MKLLITLITTLFLQSVAVAETTPQDMPGNIAIHIAEMHYQHPVRLMHPYLDYWHMKGPSAEKAALSTLQKQFSHVQLCNEASHAEVLLFIEPHMFYNPQSRLFYAKLIVKAYDNDNSSKTRQPILKITKEAQQVGELNSTPEFYIEKAYIKAMQLVINELETNQAFLDTISSSDIKHVETICPALDELPVSKLYY
jgi:hypothetical protein